MKLAAAWVIAAAALAIAACSHKDAEKSMSETDYADSVQSQAAAACTRTASAAPPGSQGTIGGRSVEYDYENARWVPRYGLDLNRANSDSSFKSLVCVLKTPVKVGTYEGKYAGQTFDANRIDWDVRVLSWPNGDVVAEHQFQGGDPPQECDNEEYCRGKDPDAEANAWLKTVITS